VKRCKVGDEVYVRLPESCRGKICFVIDNNRGLYCTRTDWIPGAWSEYAKTPEQYIALKPPSLTFEDAASLPLAAMTALQALRQHSGDLTGKTVFIPAGRM
jgi:NADPH:quinone reductase-like Zn-dependent oxidoreductase